MISRCGQFCFRHRWVVLTLWLAAIVAGALAAGPVFQGMSDGNQLRHTESGDGNAMIQTDSSVVHLIAQIEGTSTVGQLPARLQAVAGVTAVEQVQAVDGRGVALMVTLQDSAVRPATELLRHVPSEIPGTVVSLGGDAVENDQINDAVAADLNGAELKSLPLTLLVLVFVFGGLIAAGLPLLATIASVAGSFGLLLIFSKVVDLDANVVTVVSMLSLALCDRLRAAARRPLPRGAGRRVRPHRRGRAYVGDCRADHHVQRADRRRVADRPALLRRTAPAEHGRGRHLGRDDGAAERAHADRRAARHRPQAHQAVAEAASDRGAGFFSRLAAYTQRHALLVTIGTAAVLIGAGAPLLNAEVRLPDDSTACPPASSPYASRMRWRPATDRSTGPASPSSPKHPQSTLDTWAQQWRIP